jgi:hypothetical protein
MAFTQTNAPRTAIARTLLSLPQVASDPRETYASASGDRQSARTLATRGAQGSLRHGAAAGPGDLDD